MVRALLVILLILASVAQADEISVEVQEQGYGPRIQTGQTAVVAYRLVVDGKTVDQRSERAPFDFVLGSNAVVPGFNQGVLGMKVGETRQVIVPPELGYGDRKMEAFPPNSSLAFTITLLQIKEPSDVDQHQATGHEHEDHDHAGEEHEHAGHEHMGHQHEHDQNELSEQFRDDDFLKSRNARDIKKPAIFEFLLRDFYTKPWRYDDGYRLVLRQCLKVFLGLLLLGVAYGLGVKRGLLSR